MDKTSLTETYSYSSLSEPYEEEFNNSFCKCSQLQKGNPLNSIDNSINSSFFLKCYNTSEHFNLDLCSNTNNNQDSKVKEKDYPMSFKYDSEFEIEIGENTTILISILKGDTIDQIISRANHLYNLDPNVIQKLSCALNLKMKEYHYESNNDSYLKKNENEENITNNLQLINTNNKLTNEEDIINNDIFSYFNTNYKKNLKQNITSSEERQIKNKNLYLNTKSFYKTKPIFTCRTSKNSKNKLKLNNVKEEKFPNFLIHNTAKSIILNNTTPTESSKSEWKNTSVFKRLYYDDKVRKSLIVQENKRKALFENQKEIESVTFKPKISSNYFYEGDPLNV